jgi:hypothetical protein
MAVLIATPLAVVATDRFTDVPDSNVHHADITWLADAGVTLGCNPPANTNFCPGDPVLRQQMASFLRRLAENQVVDAATAIEADHAADADTLDGEPPSAYQTVINGASCGFSDCTDPTGAFEIIKQVELTVTAPTTGTLAISASLTGFDGGLNQLWVAVDQTDNDGCGTWFLAPGQAVDGSYAATTPTDALSLASSTAADIPAGSHTVALCTTQFAAGGSIDGAGLQTVWSANGSGVSLATQSFAESELARLEEAKEAATG